MIEQNRLLLLPKVALGARIWTEFGATSADLCSEAGLVGRCGPADRVGTPWHRPLSAKTGTGLCGLRFSLSLSPPTLSLERRLRREILRRPDRPLRLTNRPMARPDPTRWSAGPGRPTRPDRDDRHDRHDRPNEQVGGVGRCAREGKQWRRESKNAGPRGTGPLNLQKAIRSAARSF